MNIKPWTNDFDFKYIKELKKTTKKELIKEHESRLTNI